MVMFFWALEAVLILSFGAVLFLAWRDREIARRALIEEN
jgi:hypothetical protein